MTAAGALILLEAISGNDNSTIRVVELNDVYVNPAFMRLKESLMKSRPGIIITHGTMEAAIIPNKVCLITNHLLVSSPVLMWLDIWIDFNEIVQF